MRKGLMASLALTLVLGFVGYTLAQQAPPQRQMGPQGPMSPGPGTQGQMGPGMGPGMMGQMGGQGMMGEGMGMGRGMGMMGPMMNSPEIMGTMMSLHGEIQTLMGQMMQKYGRAMETMTPELQPPAQLPTDEPLLDKLTQSKR